MEKPSPAATYVAIAVAVSGFILIAAAWDGAAERNFVPAQFPYLLSGGLVGLGLIVVGTMILVLQALKQDGLERAREIEQLRRSVLELTTLLSPPDEYDPVVAGEFRPRPRVAPVEQPTAVAPDASGFERPA